MLLALIAETEFQHHIPATIMVDDTIFQHRNIIEASKVSLIYVWQGM